MFLQEDIGARVEISWCWKSRKLCAGIHLCRQTPSPSLHWRRFRIRPGSQRGVVTVRGRTHRAHSARMTWHRDVTHSVICQILLKIDNIYLESYTSNRTLPRSPQLSMVFYRDRNASIISIGLEIRRPAFEDILNGSHLLNICPCYSIPGVKH